MTRTRLFRFGSAVASTLTVAALALSACAPGPSGDSGSSPAPTGEVSKDIASAGPVTLTVWDQNTDGGIREAQEKLNAQFQEM